MCDSDTLLNGAYDFVFGVKSLSVQTTFSVRSASVLEDLFFCVLRGAPSGRRRESVVSLGPSLGKPAASRPNIRARHS